MRILTKNLRPTSPTRLMNGQTMGVNQRIRSSMGVMMTGTNHANLGCSSQMGSQVPPLQKVVVVRFRFHLNSSLPKNRPHRHRHRNQCHQNLRRLAHPMLLRHR